MAYYQVDVEETVTTQIWVEADSREDAIEAAEELSYGELKETLDIDFTVSEWDHMPKGTRYWAGGEDGAWRVA